MSHAYAGDPLAGFPTTIPIPDDGDLKNAATVGAALEGLMDGLVALALVLTGAAAPAATATLRNPTLKGNTTIQNNGSDRTVSVVNVDINVDDQTNFDISGPAASSPTIGIARHATITGAWSFEAGNAQTFKDAIVLSGASAHVVSRPARTMTGNTDQNIAVTGANGADVHVLLLGEFLANHKGVVANGTRIGQTVRVVSEEPAFDLELYAQDTVTAITDANTSPIKVNANPGGGGEYAAVLLMWNGTLWRWVGQ